jgi:putative transposase
MTTAKHSQKKTQKKAKKARQVTPSFVCELPLVLAGDDERILGVRFEVAHQAYNLMRESKAYQAARQLPRGPKGSEAAKARSEAFRAVNLRFGFVEADLQHWAVAAINHQWLGKHLDANTVQTLATRAFKAAQQYAFGKRGRPRFKGCHDLDSLEGKTNKQGILWRKDRVQWLGLELRARIPADDPVIAHGLSARVKFVRLVRRRLNGKTRYGVQLVCEGRPYRKEKNVLGQGRIGIDPGPRVFGLAGETWGAQVDLTAPLKETHQEIRKLQRQIDRRRRANNPNNYQPDGQVKPGRLKWAISNKQKAAETKLAEAYRKAAAHRDSEHGQLINAMLRLGDDIRVEKNSYKWFQSKFGRSVGSAAPGAFVAELKRKAVNAGARFGELPTQMRLSQVCHGCGSIVKKPLQVRIHVCECGVGPVQRDVYSAWLACLAMPGPEGPEWRLEACRAEQAWRDAESRLPAASSLISVQAFAAWAKQVATGGLSSAGLPQEWGGIERLAGKADARTDKARVAVSNSPIHVC